jgi:Co/Zn/Cd efflux system component
VEPRRRDREACVADLHTWRVGRTSHACALTVVVRDIALSASEVRKCLSAHKKAVHATIDLMCAMGAADWR